MNYIMKLLGLVATSIMMISFSIFLLIVALVLRGAYAWLFEGYTIPAF